MKIQRQVPITAQSATRIAVAAVALCIASIPQATACGLPTNANSAALRAMKLAPMLALRTSGLTPPTATASAGNQAGENSPFIVGMWDVTMRTADGLLYDHAFQQLSSDGNELQFSGVYTPDEGNVCYGIWKQQDARTFKVKHYWLSPEHSTLQGVFVVTATITVGTPAGPNTYFGTFVADLVLPSGATDPGWHAVGTMEGKRLTVD